MAGTPEGARKALETKLKKYGKDALKTWGKKGGEARNVSPNKFSPFEDNPEYAREMGMVGFAARWGKDPTKRNMVTPKQARAIKPRAPRKLKAKPKSPYQ